MRVLVTGGAGFIGSHIVDELLKAGHSVCVVDSLITGNRNNLPDDVSVIQGDVTDLGWLAEVVQAEAPDVISHQAAQISVVRSVEDPAYDAEQNVLGVISVLEAARKAKSAPKIVFASSGGAVYGNPDSIPVPETAPVNPASPYGLSKSVGEQYIKLHSQLHGLRFTILRYSNVYGPRQSAEGEAGVCAIFTNRALAGEPMKIFGDGSQTRDYVYVKDVARANLLSLTSGDGETLNIGTGVETSTKAVFETIRSAAGYDKEVIYADARPGEVQGIALDCTRAGLVLGWHPETNFNEGIQATVDSVRSQLGLPLNA